MFRYSALSKSIEVGFYLAQRFSIAPFINAIEPLRMANKISGEALFHWLLISNKGSPVEAINGMTVMVDKSMKAAGFVPNLICCVGFEPIIPVRNNVKAWLRGLDSEGAHLGALGAGSVFLAEAGLLENYRATIHWQYLESFQERFPGIQLTQNIFEIDRKRFTCAGGTAAMDMMIHLISLHFGSDLASAVSDQFITGEVRSAENEQLRFRRARLGINNDKVNSTIDLMEQNVEYPLPIAQLASKAGVSQRHLGRLFQDHLGQSPVHYCVRIRLNHARRMLLQSTLSVIEVGLASGFASAEHFSRSYKAFFGYSPSGERTLVRNLQKRLGRTGEHPL